MIKVDIFDDGNIVAYDNTIADSVLFERINFTFPESWSGYSKTAVFRNDENTISVVLNGDSSLCTGENECYVPYEVIKAPYFTVSVFGILGDSRATTPQVKITVKESGYGDGDLPKDPTPGEYEQIISLSTDAIKIAQSVREDADNGLFKGDKGADGTVTFEKLTTEQKASLKGEKGDKGDKGDKGEKGDMPIDENTEFIFDGGNAEDETEVDIVVDGELSLTSKNPVENRAVTEAISNLASKDYVEQEIANFDLTAYVKNTDLEQIVSSVVLASHPIGSIYWSEDSTNPENLFGGTWKQIKDTFLLAAGDTYTAGTAGGEAEHTLTVDEMPKHTHGVGIEYTVLSGNETPRLSSDTVYASALTSATGGDQPHNNMPPYLAVYVWQRIA